jgi:cytochrome c oxidase cbb3-type subunit 3
MPRFGADGILKPEEIAAVADHAQALYGGAPGPNAEAGKRLFAENCAVCHGPAGEGVRDVGGPRLASRVHLYGSDRDAILAQIREPKHGAMPSWRSRLDEARIKALALHVHDLGGGE